MSADPTDVIVNGATSTPAAHLRMHAGMAAVVFVAGFLGGTALAREPAGTVPVASRAAAGPVSLFPPDWLVYRAGERGDRQYQPPTSAWRTYRAGEH